MTLKELKKEYVLSKFDLELPKVRAPYNRVKVYYVQFNKKLKVLSKEDLKKFANEKIKTSSDNLEVIFAKCDVTGIGRNRKMMFNTIKVEPKDVNIAFIVKKKHNRSIRRELNNVII